MPYSSCLHTAYSPYIARAHLLSIHPGFRANSDATTPCRWHLDRVCGGGRCTSLNIAVTRTAVVSIYISLTRLRNAAALLLVIRWWSLSFVWRRNRRQRAFAHAACARCTRARHACRPAAHHLATALGRAMPSPRKLPPLLLRRARRCARAAAAADAWPCIAGAHRNAVRCFARRAFFLPARCSLIIIVM